MMLAWPGSEREALDDFIFLVLIIRLIVFCSYYDLNLSQNNHFVTYLREQLKASRTNCEVLKFGTWRVT